MADLNESPAVESPAVESPAADEPSLRDALDAAFEESATDEGARTPADGERARDEAGRFAPKTPTEAPGAPQAPPKSIGQGVTAPAPRPGLPEGAAPAAAELKAPAQWKPEAREKWGTVDASVKAEINRREREFQTHLQSSAGLRDFVSTFENIVRPYEMFIRAENSNPLAAVSNLFQTAAELRVGTPQGKASMVAGLCAQYAIDLSLLDTALAQRYGVATQGVNPQAAAAPQQQFQDPRVDQWLMYNAMQQQQAAERETAEIQSQTLNFAEQHEFFEDVRMDMADMIEMSARRGIVLPVKEAYEKACAMNPEVSKILAQRNGSSSNPRAMTQAALRAKRAASSVKGESSPHGTATNQGESLRGAIEAAFEQSGSSRL